MKSMHDKKKFLDRMAECLELPEVAADYEFRSGPEWSSLQGFAMLVSLETEFGHPMMVDEFLTMRTVGDLARACGIEGV